MSINVEICYKSSYSFFYVFNNLLTLLKWFYEINIKLCINFIFIWSFFNTCYSNHRCNFTKTCLCYLKFILHIILNRHYTWRVKIILLKLTIIMLMKLILRIIMIRKIVHFKYNFKIFVIFVLNNNLCFYINLNIKIIN